MVTQTQTIEGYALSEQQEHLWTVQAGQDSAYCTIGHYLLEGNLDFDLLSRSLQLVQDRHEILRTRFSSLDGMDLPLQTIATEASVPIEQLDLSGLSDDRQYIETQALYERLRNLPLLNSNQLPLHTHLIKLSAKRHVLLISMPAMCSDAYGLRNLMREISRCYSACAGAELGPNESLQYADYTQWQQEVTSAEGAHSGRKHWEQDRSSARFPELHFRRSNCEESDSFRPTSIEFDPNLRDIQGIIEQTHGGPSARDVLFSCWQILLYRLLGSEGLTVAAACDGRKYPELQSAIGLYEKYLPIRTTLTGDQNVADVVKEAQTVLQDAYRFQDYFTWKLMNDAIPLRQALPTAYSFEYQVAPSPESVANDLTISLARWFVYSDRFDVRLSCIERGSELTAELHYDQSHVSENDARRLAEEFRALISSAAAHPHAAIGTLNVLSSEERNQLLVEWNTTAVTYSTDRCIHELFEAASNEYPNAAAVVFEDHQLTYSQLNARANQVAHHLKSLGVGPDLRVGLCMYRSVDLIVGLLGILKAGGAYVALDPALPQERLRWMLSDSGSQVLLTQAALASVAEADGVCVCLDRDAGLIGLHDVHNAVSAAKPHHLVYVIYTSGSTGRPKGVAVEHRQLVNYVLGVSERFGFKAGANYASVSTLAADLGNTMVFPALCLAGCLHLLSPDRAMDGAGFGEYLSTHRIDCLKIVPSHLRALLGEGVKVSQNLPREVLVLGGEASSWELMAQIREASPALRVFNHYGPTETTVGVLTYDVVKGLDRDAVGSVTIPLGRPLPNSCAYVLNGNQEPVPVGVVGELYIGGSGVARGYLERPELTQERFVSDPFSRKPGATMYRTGDMVRWLRDGNLEFLGRADDQVKIRGFRIELGEIESVLLSHPTVREAVVLAREDVPGDKRLVAYVLGLAGSVSISTLRDYLAERLPEYMIPSAWLMLERLPLTANGKVDRKALPAPESMSSEASYVAPRTSIEEGLAEIWRDLLHVEQVGIHDNFFDLGGHSLLAVRLVSEVRRLFGQKLPLHMLFQSATIATIARELSPEYKTTCWANVSTVTPIRPGSTRIPMFCTAAAQANALGYVALGRSLGEDQPLFVLQTHYRTNTDRPYTIEELHDLAAVHIRAMRDLHPEGPYCLGGMCEGAHIAFEMARQLQSEGEEVPLLVSFDAWPEQNTRTHVGWWLSGVSIAFARRKSDKKIGMFWVMRQIARLTWRSCRQFGMLIFKSQDSHSWEARYWPGSSFVPPKFEGKVTVFRVARQQRYRPNHRDLGWTEWTTRGVDINDVPGEHRTLLREPHVQRVAALLAEHLNHVQRTSLTSTDATLDPIAVATERPGDPRPELYASVKS